MIRKTDNKPANILKIQPSLTSIVQDVLSCAWKQLLKEVGKGKFDICVEPEDVITTKLHWILGSLHSSPPTEIADFKLFDVPSRDEKIPDRYGMQLDLQPDLTFRFKPEPTSAINGLLSAVFVECKPIDSDHPIGSTYCKKGIARFVENKYAWGVDRGMMLGYVRKICHLPVGLGKVLGNQGKKKQYKTDGKLEPLGRTYRGEPVYTSTHRRTNSNPITLHHLWLKPEEPCENTRCRN